MLLGIRGDFLTFGGMEGGALSSASPDLPPSPARSRPSLRQQEGESSFLFLVSFLFVPSKSRAVGSSPAGGT